MLKILILAFLVGVVPVNGATETDCAELTAEQLLVPDFDGGPDILIVPRHLEAGLKNHLEKLVQRGIMIPALFQMVNFVDRLPNASPEVKSRAKRAVFAACVYIDNHMTSQPPNYRAADDMASTYRAVKQVLDWLVEFDTQIPMGSARSVFDGVLLNAIDRLRDVPSAPERYDWIYFVVQPVEYLTGKGNPPGAVLDLMMGEEFDLSERPQFLAAYQKAVAEKSERVNHVGWAIVAVVNAEIAPKYAEVLTTFTDYLDGKIDAKTWNAKMGAWEKLFASVR